MTTPRYSSVLALACALSVCFLWIEPVRAMGPKPPPEPPGPASVRNVILMIGDGMGPEQVALARLFAPLAMDSLDGNPNSMTTDNVDGEVTDSTGQIRNDGFWYVLTGDLGRQIKKYAVCVDAVVAPYGVVTPFLLADRDSEKKGTFFASGNIVERYSLDGVVGDWVGLSLRIDLQEGSACTDDTRRIQESGITIR